MLGGEPVTLAKRILSVGYPYQATISSTVSPDSRRSLSDADIVLFVPTLLGETDYGDRDGKPILTGAGTLQAERSAQHWRNELATAASEGKTVVIYLTAMVEAYAKSGVVITSYDQLPFRFDAVQVHGTEIRPGADFQ